MDWVDVIATSANTTSAPTAPTQRTIIRARIERRFMYAMAHVIDRTIENFTRIGEGDRVKIRPDRARETCYPPLIAATTSTARGAARSACRARPAPGRRRRGCAAAAAAPARRGGRAARATRSRAAAIASSTVAASSSTRRGSPAKSGVSVSGDGGLPSVAHGRDLDRPDRRAGSRRSPSSSRPRRRLAKSWPVLVPK